MIRKIVLLSSLCISAVTGHAQKKLTPVAQSTVTGIGLPNGSKQDGRMLSVAAAATLLEMESDKTNTTLQTTEVLVLPPASSYRFTKDSLVQRLTTHSWKIVATEGDNYLWLQNGNRFVIAYFSMNDKETGLYFAETNSTPALPAAVTRSTSQPPPPPVNNHSATQSTQSAAEKKDNTSTSILGIWTASTSDQSSYRVNNGVMNYIKRQYTFSDNGTYTFISKTFDPLMNKILLGKEGGTYQISGSSITVTPQKSVLEAWSKKDGTDKWGNFLNTQNIALEKVTYQFTKHYFSGIQEWSLVLQTSNVTQRDGPFSNNATFSNAYYYSPISSSHPVIELPGSQSNVQEPKKQTVNTPAVKSGFTFSTTNFNDGWTSTEQSDWIQVTKGNIKVLIHYPNKSADAYNSVLMDGLKNAWNILVAPKYSSASNFEFKPVSGWQSIEFGEADAVEKITGKAVHVVLFKMNYSNGSGKYMEFITPDKKTYEQEFGPYRQESYGWEKVEVMANYNKFAVAPSDLIGKWTSDFSGMTQYVNANTGADAGATAHSSNESFEFMANNTYQWQIGVASGMVGNMKFQSAKSTGTFSLPNNWQIYFSDLEGKPKTYNAYFSCVKGSRIVWLEDVAYPSGYKGYGKLE